MNIQQILYLTTLSVHNNMKQVRIIHFYRHTNVSQQLRNAFVQKNAMFTQDRLHFCSQFPRQSFFVVARLIKVFVLRHEIHIALCQKLQAVSPYYAVSKLLFVL